MEITALLKSWTNDIPGYLRTRFLSVSMAALILLLIAIAWSLSLPDETIVVLTDTAIATLLVLQFRLGDDLCDVESDRVIHTDRVLVRAPTLAPFWWLLISLATFSMLLITSQRSSQAVMALVILQIILIAWYCVPRRSKWKTWSYHVVLLKYPTFVFILANRIGRSLDSATLSAMLCTYLALCVYEVWHDDQLRAMRFPRAIAAVETVALLTIIAYSVQGRFQAGNDDDGSISSRPAEPRIYLEGNPP